MKTTGEILSGIERVAREEILRDFRPDSCIASTRTVIRVLRHYGIEAKPVTCRVLVWNAIMNKAFLDGTNKTNADPDFRQWCEVTGAWSVGVGFDGDGGPERVGHLVAVLPKERLLIDASIDQASRPERGIRLPPVLMQPITNGFMEHPGASLDLWNHSNGVAVIYERIAAHRWKSSPDWAQRIRTERARAAIIARIEEGL